MQCSTRWMTPGIGWSCVFPYRIAGKFSREFKFGSLASILGTTKLKFANISDLYIIESVVLMYYILWECPGHISIYRVIHYQLHLRNGKLNFQISQRNSCHTLEQIIYLSSPQNMKTSLYACTRCMKNWQFLFQGYITQECLDLLNTKQLCWMWRFEYNDTRSTYHLNIYI